MATDLTARSSAPASEPADLQELARRHLWMHFTRMGDYGPDAEIPIIVRGEGCYVFDEHGKRYLDGLSALFCVNTGHGRAGARRRPPPRRPRELGFFTNWSYAHPRAIELAARIAGLAPDGPRPRLLHLRRLGGGRVGVEARRASTTGCAATPRARRSSPASSPTTARRSARSPRPACRR